MTKEQVQQAELMRGKNMTWSAIGRQLGVSRMTVRNYIYPDRRQAEYLARNATRRAQAAAAREDRATRMKIETHYALPIPQEVLAERERRLSLAPQSLTAALLGDPLTADWHKRA